ncbi:MAG: glutamate--tRNA ligase [Gemmatimonadota bacterium]|jgi:glutamyl-tRNA synthetase
MPEPDAIRVRFAPSPTGYLHVGGARTALFNWLLARKRGGTFVLRIEDTDRERSSEEHTEAILEGMEWLGLDVDEGPLFQGGRVEEHRRDALRLLGEGKAYRDFTDPATLRAEAEEEGIDHPSLLARRKADAMGPDEAEARAAAGEPHAVRFRVPPGETAWDDLVHGPLRFENADLDDLVVLRSDGTPTYNMAVVSDDAGMGITHVVRGDDHLSNTPKQILLYEALGREVPRFGHVPLILGPDGKRLSKRHGATAVSAYADEGILPEAMVNFLALLGWNPGDEREVMTVAELIDAFSMERVLKKSAVFDTEKLEWLNGQHLARRPAEALERLVVERLAAHGVDPRALEGRGEWLRRLIDLLKVRARTVDDLAAQALPFAREELEYEAKAVARHWEKDPAAARDRLSRLRTRLDDGPWEEGALEDRLRALADEMGVGAGKIIHPLRVALTGRQHSPGIFDVLALLGRARSLRRIDDALARIDDGS